MHRKSSLRSLTLVACAVAGLTATLAARQASPNAFRKFECSWR